MADRRARLRALSDRATHPATPVEEARSCALQALLLMRELGLAMVPPAPQGMSAREVHEVRKAAYEAGVREGRALAQAETTRVWVPSAYAEFTSIPISRGKPIGKKDPFKNIARATPVARRTPPDRNA